MTAWSRYLERRKRIQKKQRRRNRRIKKAEAIIEEETQEDVRSLRAWRLIPVPPELVLEDALSGREVRIAALARGKNPAVLDSSEMELAEKIMKKCRPWGWEKERRSPATYILGRVPADFKTRVQHTRTVLGFLPREA